MTNHDVAVLSGNLGSEKRTQKINKMVNELDKAVSDARDQDKENVLISAGYLADRLNYSSSTINRNGYPQFFKTNFESITHKNKKGLLVRVDKFVEERKEQREKLSELNKDDKK